MFVLYLSQCWAGAPHVTIYLKAQTTLALHLVIKNPHAIVAY